MAHKYQIKNVLDHAIGFIKDFYSLTLTDFVAALNEPAWGDAAIAACVEVLNLARLVGDNSLLLPALYVCCQVSPEVLFGANGEGTHAALRRLSEEDLGRCLSGKAYLASARRWIRSSIFALEHAKDCIDRRCTSVIREIKDMHEDLDVPEPGDMSLCNAFDQVKMGGGEKTLCGACVRMFREKERNAHEVVWYQLPKALNL